jgi:hypothetical protein
LQIGKVDIKGNDRVKRVYSPEGLSPTLDTMQGGWRQPKVIVQTSEKICYVKIMVKHQMN